MSVAFLSVTSCLPCLIRSSIVAGAVGREVGVPDQRDVLDRVRHAVELAAERHALDRERIEAGRVGQPLDRVDRAVLDEVADDVMRPDDDVRRVSRLAGGLELRR